MSELFNPPVRRRAAIVTERLRLRPPQSSDYGNWAALRRESRRHLEPWEPAWAQDALMPSGWRRVYDAWRDGWRVGRAFAFFLWRARDDALLGGVTLSNVRYGNAQSGALGYWLGAAHTGQGYMREGVRAVCDWAFESLRLERIEAAALPANAASRNVLSSVGFEEEGFAKAYLQIAGRREDHVLYGLVRE